MIIRVERPIRSLNQLLRWHWATRKREQKAWELEIWAAFNGRVPKAKGKVKIDIISHRKQLLDLDNLWGGAKIAIDAMKALEICLDDSPKFAEIICTQIKTPGSRPGQTEIRIEETL